MREFIDGATAIVRGALDSGCTFFAGYPITPASGILMQMMRELPRAGGVAVQGEDEIASIGMCIGATLAGARAMTATSGPGISLYSENIGLAIMGEVPLRVMEVTVTAMDVIAAMASRGLAASASDAGVGALCARSAVLGADLNVRINVGGLADTEVAYEYVTHARRLRERAMAKEAEILATVESRL